MGMLSRSIQYMTILALIRTSQVSAAIDVNRIGSFLSRHCHEISSFLIPACNGINTPPCCSLFALVDVCRSTCNGKSNPYATQTLVGLLKDPAVCSQIQMAGQKFCQYRNTRECKALQCLRTLICIDSRAQCFEPKPKAQPSERRNRHQMSRSFQLPETAACGATNLVEFDAKNVRECPLTVVTKVCNSSTLIYRTVDGSCNNLQHPDWGKSFHPPKRYLPAVYDDGEDFPRHRGIAGKPLKSPRYVSRYMSPEVSHKTHHSSIVMTWGQFIDHDFTGFPVIKKNSTDIKCCADNLDPSLRIENGGPCYPISIDDKEDFFEGKRCMEFSRSSAADDDKGILLSPREQINALTSYIDGSTVYGSTQEVNNMLRLPNGKLATGPNNMLPRSKKKNCKIVDNSTDYCLLAGDHRVNVFVGLGVFHTIFHREHNRLVDGLAKVNPTWDGEELYQEARKIVSALHQHITYNEYLPSFLSNETMTKYRLWPGDFKYDPTLRADMANVFSTAAFRFGHSQVPHFVQAGTDRYNLEDTLMRTHLVLTRFDDVTKGLAFGASEDVDRFFVEGLTDRMFERVPFNRDGLDLVSLNVQRGRDHGLPSYNEFRKFCKLIPVDTFDSSIFEKPNYLGTVYEDPDDIDVFIGGVTERRTMAGSLVGPLFSCLIGQQFHDTKFGDRFFYETKSRREGFSPEQLQEIKKQTLASVMCANTNIDRLQTQTMYVPDINKNPIIPCTDMPNIDLSKWASRK